MGNASFHSCANCQKQEDVVQVSHMQYLRRCVEDSRMSKREGMNGMNPSMEHPPMMNMNMRHNVSPQKDKSPRRAQGGQDREGYDRTKIKDTVERWWLQIEDTPGRQQRNGW